MGSRHSDGLSLLIPPYWLSTVTTPLILDACEGVWIPGKLCPMAQRCVRSLPQVRYLAHHCRPHRVTTEGRIERRRTYYPSSAILRRRGLKRDPMHLPRSPVIAVLLFAWSLAHPQTPVPPSTPRRAVHHPFPQHARLCCRQGAKRRRPAASQPGWQLHPGPNPYTCAETLSRSDVPMGSSPSRPELSRQQVLPGHCPRPRTFGKPDPNDPAKLMVNTSHPAPYTRRVTVYVPRQYLAGTVAPSS